MLVLPFRIGAAWYGVDAREVVEVIPHVPLRPCPGAPPYVAGVLNYRGSVVPVLDLGLRTGAPPCAPRLSTRILVATYPGRDSVSRRLGLLAESMTATLALGEDAFLGGQLSLASTPYLGPLAAGAEGLVQCVRIDGLIPAEVEPLLFAACGASI